MSTDHRNRAHVRTTTSNRKKEEDERIDVIARGMMRRITSDALLYVVPLVHTDIVDVHLGREHEMIQIHDGESSGHSKVQDNILQ